MKNTIIEKIVGKTRFISDKDPPRVVVLAIFIRVTITKTRLYTNLYLKTH